MQGPDSIGENPHENLHKLPVHKLKQKKQFKVVHACLLFKFDSREDFFEDVSQLNQAPDEQYAIF